jgi:SAM-dependent methyltransferase
MTDDVPGPIDLRPRHDAVEWERTAMSKSPWRTEFFARFANEIMSTSPVVTRILELGYGPGFLAEHLLRALDRIDYALLDFSPAMHELALARLGDLSTRATFAERSFKGVGWPAGLGTYHCVVTHRAVHELRHKRHVTGLHTQVRSLMAAAASTSCAITMRVKAACGTRSRTCRPSNRCRRCRPRASGRYGSS